MKVTLERNALLKSLGHVHRVVERRNTYPILANVLLKAADGQVDLRATDLDIEVTESVPAMVATAGHHHGSGAHALRNRAQALRRRRSPARDRRRRADAADLGPLALPPRVPVARQLPRSQIGRLHPRLLAAGRDLPRADRAHPVRHLQRGDALLSQRHLRAHARGQRRARCCAPSPPTATAWPAPRPRRPTGARGMPGIIIPKKTVGEVQKLLDGAEGDVGIEISDTKIRFTLGGVVLLSQAHRGHLPRLRPRDAQEQRQAAQRRPRRASPPPSTASRPSRPIAAARR